MKFYKFATYLTTPGDEPIETAAYYFAFDGGIPVKETIVTISGNPSLRSAKLEEVTEKEYTKAIK
ncbi:MAG: hypothetical protein ABIJ20_00595 [Nanoarchaeota archaeon]|nr:hypothetical protein [Nanoarchaeota archaeon]MBU1445406.1 hypothetical protein [Nanoarchaeota archaeon]MBU2406834.1 hypothetical protein [Nanoarchaeota archaeon]MBU2420179.1 hypothetical protein [Nanoarchaeota archaeon]MBU2475371.1 hypothetical protein [Nanoarchaeota archaeon]